MKKLILAIVFVLAITTSSVVFADSKVVLPPKDEYYNNKEFRSAAEQFVCPCGCNQGLYVCNHQECPDRDQMHAEILAMLDQGKTKKEISDYYVKLKGEEVLAVPAKSGFSLVVWLLPFFAIILGVVIVALVVRNLVKNKNNDDVNEVTDKEEMDNEIIQGMIDEERKKYF